MTEILHTDLTTSLLSLPDTLGCEFGDDAEFRAVYAKKISDITNDNKLVYSERLEISRDFDNLKVLYTNLKASAKSLGANTVNLEEAYTALENYLEKKHQKKE
jgi:hypothetical protein